MSDNFLDNKVNAHDFFAHCDERIVCFLCEGLRNKWAVSKSYEEKVCYQCVHFFSPACIKTEIGKTRLQKWSHDLRHPSLEPSSVKTERGVQSTSTQTDSPRVEYRLPTHGSPNPSTSGNPVYNSLRFGTDLAPPRKLTTTLTRLELEDLGATPPNSETFIPSPLSPQYDQLIQNTSRPPTPPVRQDSLRFDKPEEAPQIGCHSDAVFRSPEPDTPILRKRLSKGKHPKNLTQSSETPISNCYNIDKHLLSKGIIQPPPLLHMREIEVLKQNRAKVIKSAKNTARKSCTITRPLITNPLSVMAASVAVVLEKLPDPPVLTPIMESGYDILIDNDDCTIVFNSYELICPESDCNIHPVFKTEKE